MIYYRRKFLPVACAITLVSGQSILAVPPQRDEPTSPPPHNLKATNQIVRIPVRSRTIVLHLYLPTQIQSDQPLVIFNSGSGGWHDFDGHVATAFALRGMPVCGISTHSYLRNFFSTAHPATLKDVVADFADIIARAKIAFGLEDSQPIILAGWSLGAGYAPLIASDSLIKPQVRGVISIAIERQNEWALSVSNRLLSRLTDRTIGPSFDVREYLARSAPLPVAIIQPAGKRTVSTKNAIRLIDSASQQADNSLRLFEVKTGESHSFSHGRAEFDQALDNALAWIKDHNLNSNRGLAHIPLVLDPN